MENSDDAGSGDDDSPDHSWSSSLMLLNGVIDVDVVWTPEEDCCRLVWSSSVPLAGHHHQHQRCGNSTAAEQQNSNSSSQQQNQNAGTYNNTTTMALFIADLEC